LWCLFFWSSNYCDRVIHCLSRIVSSGGFSSCDMLSGGCHLVICYQVVCHLVIVHQAGSHNAVCHQVLCR
jgi:hypothetical protein